MNRAAIATFHVLESFSRSYRLGTMSKPPIPPDLKHCPECGKVMGDHKGWFGPQCFCGDPKGNFALRGAHGRGTGSNNSG
jgi:hypothetical protein